MVKIDRISRESLKQRREKKKIDDAMSLSFSRLIIFHKSNKKHNVSDDFSHEEFVLVQYCFLPNTIWKCQQKQPTDILSFSLSRTDASNNLVSLSELIFQKNISAFCEYKANRWR